MTDVDSGLRDIAEIRSIMERSTKFISLSGFSGIGAGAVALAGAWAAWVMFCADGVVLTYSTTAADLQPDTRTSLLLLGVAVLLLALAIAWFFSRRIIRKHAEPVHGPVMRQLVLSLAVPLLVGAIMTLLLFYHGPLWPVVPLDASLLRTRAVQRRVVHVRRGEDAGDDRDPPRTCCGPFP